MQDTSKNITFDRLAYLLFFTYSLDNGEIKFKRTIQIGIDCTRRYRPRPTTPEISQTVHDFLRLSYLQGRSLGRRDIVNNQLILYRLLIMIMQLMHETANLACLQSVASCIIKQTDMAGTINQTIEMIRPNTVLMFVCRQTESTTKIIRNK